jgi:ribonuclease HI
MGQFKLFSDGASRGNPGPAAVGVSILDDKSEVATISEVIGVQTNNFAEYTALIRGLEQAKAAGYSDLECFADSELMIKQLNGIYKVKNPQIKVLYDQIIKLKSAFQSIKFIHVRRHLNKRADELANLALDS